MTGYSVVGELSADRSTIVLMGLGPDHAVAEAAKRLEFLTPLLKKSDPPGAMLCPASWSAAIQLSSTFGPAWVAGPNLRLWLAEQVMARTAPPTELAVTPPPGLVPRSYQVAGAAMIGAVGSALLFDDPGTGKTPTTILGLVERAAAGHPVLPIVVVAPSAVVDSWVDHFQRWAPRWRVVAWRGSPARRRKLIGLADIYVASYGTAARDAKTIDMREVHKGNAPLMALGARTIVADEVHRTKASGSTYSVAVRNLATRSINFVGLSGTPITHSPKDLWPALYSMAPTAYPSSERWALRYCLTAPGEYAVTVLGLNPMAEPEFRQTLLGQHRRVSKADVLTELPPKVYSVRQVEMPKQYREAYDAVEQEMLADLPDDGGELSPMTVLSQMTSLSALASAAADVETTWETVEDPATGLPMEKRHQHITLKLPSWKVDELLDILDERPNAKVVSFAPSAQLMRLAGQKATDAGYRVGYVIGGQTAKERTANVDAFQRGELDLMCATTGAGGVGLTLTAASTVVFLQRPWSLVEALQSEDRCHRIGSEIHDSIEIVDIVAAHTIESRVRQVLVERAGQLSNLVQDPRIVAELLGGARVRDLRRKSVAA
jgi:SNF2 family DNA or RNA helicase